MTGFNGVEGAVYGAVEYIPALGAVYSLTRSSVAYKEKDWSRMWQSAGNVLEYESAIRNALLIIEVGEPVPVVILQTMAELLTDEHIKLYFESAKKPKIHLLTSFAK